MQYRTLVGGGEEFREIWSPDPGYSVNNVSKGGATTNLKAGDRVWIRKMTGIGTRRAEFSAPLFPVVKQ